MVINLNPARRKVESFMTETAVVYGPDAVDLMPYNQTTGGLVLPIGGTKLYDGVAKFKDIVRQSRGGGSNTAEGGLSLLVVATKIDFPVGDVPGSGFPSGALIICTDALRMPQLIGAQYILQHEDLKTFGIQYTVLADRRRAVDL